MCSMYTKRLELFSLISPALFVALNTEGSEMCFNCINCNVKLIQHRLIKFSCLRITSNVRQPYDVRTIISRQMKGCRKTVMQKLQDCRKTFNDTSYVSRTAVVRFAAFLRQPCEQAHGYLEVVLRLT